MDEIIADLTGRGFPVVRVHFPRSYVDVNREPYELDPRMFSRRLPSFANTRSMRVAGGLGTIPRVVGDGQEIYSERLDVEEALNRIEVLYKPYHRALRRLLNKAHQAFGTVILVDCHSMPSIGVTRDEPKRPDVVIGDPIRLRRATRTIGGTTREVLQAVGTTLGSDNGIGCATMLALALAGLVDIGYVKATGSSVKITLPRTAMLPETELEWTIPRYSNTLERNRARTYFQAYAAAAALHFVDKALAEIHAGRTRTWAPFAVPDEAIGCGFHEAVRGVLSHHMVIRGGKIDNYQPYPPTPWNASPRDSYGTPGPYEDAVEGTPIFEENGPESFKGIDILRTVRSFDPCLPCGVHMYLGGGKELEVRCSPTFGVLTDEALRLAKDEP